MSPRASSTGSADPTEETTEPEPTQTQKEMNETMAAQAEEPPASVYPPGADELTAANVRRYPDLFTDEQKATIDTEPLPETETEKAQREAAEAAES